MKDSLTTKTYSCIYYSYVEASSESTLGFLISFSSRTLLTELKESEKAKTPMKNMTRNPVICKVVF